MIEFEIKIQVSNFDNIRLLLKKNYAKMVKIENQRDLYFNHPMRDFVETDEALRVRFIEDKIEITYKGPKISDTSKSRLEINSLLLDSNIIEILTHVGFKLSGEVHKKRESWDQGGITVSLDEIKNLGTFIELEIIGDNENQYQELVERLRQVATLLKLNVNDQIMSSYLELLTRT